MSTSAPSDLMSLHNAVMAECGFSDPNEVGIVGDVAHAARGGYHISSEDIDGAGKYGSDYSTSRARDHFLTGYASAMDIGDDWPRGGRAAWLRFNNALAGQIIAGDPAVAAIRAVNFSPDGVAKKRYDTGNRSSGVINSTDTVNIHTHIEWWRDTLGAPRSASITRIHELIIAARDNKTIGDNDMDAAQAKQLADVTYTLTTGPLGAEHVRWATGMVKLDLILTKLGVAQVDIDALTARPPINVDALAVAIASHLPDSVNAAAVLAAFNTPEVQAILTSASEAGANLAEDS